MMNAPRIALIHALRLSIAPIEAAFARAWPEARVFNLLDDSLSIDRAAQSDLDAAMFARFDTLSRYAHRCGADAILFTCSAFAPCIDAMKSALPIPVLRPNEAMFEMAIASGGSVGLLSSFAPSIASMTPEFAAMAAASGKQITLTTHAVPQAMQALANGDGAGHDQLLAAEGPRFAHCDTVMLAQFSTARAREALASRYAGNVLTSPDAAVAKIRSLLTV
jgi:hypothetical protein